MKIILLYGPGEAAKRNEALRIRKQFASEDISFVDFKQINTQDLEVQFVSSSLFQRGPRLIVAENAPDNLSLQKLKVADDSLTLLILAGNLKADSQLFLSAKKLNAKLVLFEGEKELTAFPFLDALIEQRKQVFLELEKLLKEYGAIYVISMIYYLLRRNILPLPKNSFIRGKIQRQKQRYSLDDFERFYYLTLTTEFKIKSGLLNENTGLTFLIQKINS